MAEANKDSIAFSSDKYDAIVPDGWDESQDFFDFAKGVSAEPEQPVAESSEPQEDPVEEPAAVVPAEPAPADDDALAEALANELAGEAGGVEPAKLKFKAKFNHEEHDIELDEADLPDIYEKAHAFDQLADQRKADRDLAKKLNVLARQNGYDSTDDFVQKVGDAFRKNAIDDLVRSGNTKEMAELILDNRYAKAIGAAPAEEESSAPAAAQSSAPAATQPGRNWKAEIDELKGMRKDILSKGIPEEVLADARAGKRLGYAYLEWEAKQQAVANSKTKQDNAVLRQNAANAARAPVTGVSGGGATDSEPDDPFLVGFNSGY